MMCLALVGEYKLFLLLISKKLYTKNTLHATFVEMIKKWVTTRLILHKENSRSKILVPQITASFAAAEM